MAKRTKAIVTITCNDDRVVGTKIFYSPPLERGSDGRGAEKNAAHRAAMRALNAIGEVEA